MQMLVSAFSNKQLDQYEVFRRATFQKGTVRWVWFNQCITIMTPLYGLDIFYVSKKSYSLFMY